MTEYDYDNLHRLTEERWMDGETEFYTATFAYDAASQLTAAGDDFSSYTYTYDALGRATLIESNNGGPQVKLTQAFDAVDNRTGLSAQIKIGAGSWTNDFQNTYTYDNLDRQIKIEQTSQTGGHAVAAKRVDLAYNADDQYTSIDRYDNLAGGSSNLVATSTYTYDGLGRLTDLAHAKDTTNLATYSWTYDAFSRVTNMSFTSLVGPNGSSDYSYDTNGQLTSTDHSFQTDEAYSYDENGNRTMTGYTTGTNNQLTSDGTFDYEYDDEGNRTLRTRISTDPALPKSSTARTSCTPGRAVQRKVRLGGTCPTSRSPTNHETTLASPGTDAANSILNGRCGSSTY